MKKPKIPVVELTESELAEQSGALLLPAVQKAPETRTRLEPAPSPTNLVGR